MYADNAVLFPHRVIPSLQKLRGPKWRELVTHVMTLPECHEETLAFMLMMIRINGCMGCETDSFRAMRGCTACTLQTLRRYKGTDDDLLRSYEEALRDIRQFANSQFVASERALERATA
jgi:hypothetical protein